MEVFERFRGKFDVKKTRNPKKFGDELRFAKQRKANENLPPLELDQVKKQNEDYEERIRVLEEELKTALDKGRSAEQLKDDFTKLEEEVGELRSDKIELADQLKNTRTSMGRLVAEKNRGLKEAAELNSDVIATKKQVNFLKSQVALSEQEKHAMKSYLVQVHYVLTGRRERSALVPARERLNDVVVDETMKRLLTSLEQIKPGSYEAKTYEVGEHRNFVKKHFAKLRINFLRNAPMKYEDLQSEEEEIERGLAAVDELIESIDRENLRLEEELRMLQLSTVSCT
uniref:Uncharacterized protein n=1 Tax=Rhodosorus marinus TaxID=101924 RepID=A0A7S3A4N6_9RHOD|mmetsp:Transcript_43526/g.170335  ORF Transcript_43526/g.170335 Transcript_43526/m.170335 type:complete len:285 (+) Transcript_43526:266-1120(+)|eukprot:CAMPEP_0113956730 /NCGR_PEP_ID=MMETSP0011_2-20120614/2250_1 /TAXON_ID=101924 /ORGANISM="Rhodosorus marinus" /LENGTH=284 /DNA_ID=CAMNT_0000966961 /DNA_START=148 /DNA_END=1002 /DNA_ORIENTATION=+ /assembly_acc=CAM_ASM_000156